MDLCVSGTGAGAVVIVNQAGEHQFTYTGCSTTGKPYNSYDINTEFELDPNSRHKQRQHPHLRLRRKVSPLYQ